MTDPDFIHSEDFNERDFWGNDPDPLTLREWFVIVVLATGAFSIIGGLIWLCLVLIRG